MPRQRGKYPIGAKFRDPLTGRFTAIPPRWFSTPLDFEPREGLEGKELTSVWVSSILHPSPTKRLRLAKTVYAQAPPDNITYKVTVRSPTRRGDKFPRGAGMFLKTRLAVTVMPGVIAYFGDPRGGTV